MSGFTYRYVPGSRAETLLLLHGTGGNETDLLGIGQRVLPGAGLLSPRGQVLENGMPRFFRRFAEGVFDVEDVKARATELGEFVREQAAEQEFDISKVWALGYSNGANVAAAMILTGAARFRRAVLLRAMVPIEPEKLPDLAGDEVLLATGLYDPMATSRPDGAVARVAGGSRGHSDGKLVSNRAPDDAGGHRGGSELAGQRMSSQTGGGTGLAADPLCLKHDTGYGHPECPERYEAVIAGLEEAGLAERLSPVAGRDVTREELMRVHTSHYLDLAENTIKEGMPELTTGDTAVCEASWDVAVRSAGLAVSAVDAVMTGQLRNAFCAVRPPGHHATATRGMGFCIFNNVAVAARHAQRAHGTGRVLIVDWDVHHGNGTQDIFYEDGSVLFFSTHQWPLYPGTGRRTETGSGDGAGLTINCPLREGAGRTEVLGAMREELEPAADRFRPDVVLISAGFDSRAGDPLGGFLLRDEDFAEMTRLVMEIAERHAGGRVVSLLEGGYNLNGLGDAVAAHVRALLGG